jgi:hypothetical protein
MHYDLYLNDSILRCPNPVLITDLRTGSHFFMVPGDYVPDKDTEFDNVVFHLLPNTTIEYKSSVNGQRFVYHLELNSDKIDEFKRQVKKFHILILPPEVINRSKLDKIKTPFFPPNEIVSPRVPSRGRYDISNYVSTSPVRVLKSR